MKTIFILLILLLSTEFIWGFEDAILLRDIQVITLEKGHFTKGRRNSPIPQLKCIGGTARSQSHKVKNVQCINKGFDGNDVNWQCDTKLDNKLKFGKLSVNCEGYNYPDDPYVLVDSCGLKYELDYTDEYYRNRQNVNYKTIMVDSNYPGSSEMDIIVASLIILLIIVTLVICIVANRPKKIIVTSTHPHTHISREPVSCPFSGTRSAFSAPPLNPEFCEIPMTQSSNVHVTRTAPVIVESPTNAFVNGVIVGSSLVQRTHPAQTIIVSGNTERNDDGEHTSTSYAKTERR